MGQTGRMSPRNCISASAACAEEEQSCWAVSLCAVSTDSQTPFHTAGSATGPGLLSEASWHFLEVSCSTLRLDACTGISGADAGLEQVLSGGQHPPLAADHRVIKAGRMLCLHSEVLISPSESFPTFGVVSVNLLGFFFSVFLSLSSMFAMTKLTS